MLYENVIWEGRFQPIHRGHLAYVRLLLNYAEHLWIFVVANERSTDLWLDWEGSPVPDFTREVDRHHGPEKNPLPFWLRYRLVEETLRTEFPNAAITIWGGRRLDLAWPLYLKTLPPTRTFLVPERDSFEDAKAAAWKTLGEQVLRIDVSNLPKISATEIRSRIQSGEQVVDFLHPATEQLLRETGYLEKLATI